MSRWTVVAFLAASAFLPAAVANAGWIDDAKYACDDPTVIRDASFMVKWLEKPAQYSRNPIRQGFYVEISQKDFNNKDLLFADMFEARRIVLDKDMATVLKLHFEKRSNQTRIPFWAQQLPSIASIPLNVGQGLILAVGTAAFFDMLGAKSTSIDTLAYISVAGGEIAQYGSVAFHDGNAVFTETVQYEVTVGQERVSNYLYMCRYPALIVMRKVKTVFPPNNPKIFEESDGVWKMINADTQTVEREFTKTGEDREFYFLKENGGSGSEYRISRLGGPVQMESEGSWANLYSETEIE